MDQAGQRSGVCRRGDRFYLGTASLGGGMTGTTGGSMPVGSAEIIYEIL